MCSILPGRARIKIVRKCALLARPRSIYNSSNKSTNSQFMILLCSSPKGKLMKKLLLSDASRKDWTITKWTLGLCENIIHSTLTCCIQLHQYITMSVELISLNLSIADCLHETNACFVHGVMQQTHSIYFFLSFFLPSLSNTDCASSVKS